MRRAIDETSSPQDPAGLQPGARHRPPVIQKAVKDITERVKRRRREGHVHGRAQTIPKDELYRVVKDLEEQMKQSARNMEFEKAASPRARSSSCARG